MELGQQCPHHRNINTPPKQGRSHRDLWSLCFMQGCVMCNQQLPGASQQQARNIPSGAEYSQRPGPLRHWVTPLLSAWLPAQTAHQLLPGLSKLVTTQLAFIPCPFTELHSAPHDGKDSNRPHALLLLCNEGKVPRVLKSYQSISVLNAYTRQEKKNITYFLPLFSFPRHWAPSL